MSFLERLSNEFVFGGHMLAVGTASIAASAAILLGEWATPSLLAMAYLFSYGAYMLNRTSEMEEDAISSPERTAHLKGRRRRLPLIVAASFLLGYALAATVNVIFFAALLAPLVLSLLYSVGSGALVGVVGVRKFKQKLLLKNLVISFSWSLIPLLVGLYYLNLQLVLLFFSVFIFIRLMANTILFDIRDIKADEAYGVKTIPVAYGLQLSFRVMSLVDLLSAVYVVSLVALRLLPMFALVLLVLPLYSMYYRSLFRRGGVDLGTICNIWADGEYLLWGPVFYLGRVLF